MLASKPIIREMISTVTTVAGAGSGRILSKREFFARRFFEKMVQNKSMTNQAPKAKVK